MGSVAAACRQSPAASHAAARPDVAALAPCCPARTQDGAMLVGQEALEPAPELQVAPADCFHSFKRLLGRT